MIVFFHMHDRSRNLIHLKKVTVYHYLMAAILLQSTVLIYKMIAIHVVVLSISSPYLLVKIRGGSEREIQYEFDNRANDGGKT